VATIAAASNRLTRPETSPARGKNPARACRVAIANRSQLSAMNCLGPLQNLAVARLLFISSIGHRGACASSVDAPQSSPASCPGNRMVGRARNVVKNRQPLPRIATNVTLLEEQPWSLVGFEPKKRRRTRICDIPLKKAFDVPLVATALSYWYSFAIGRHFSPCADPRRLRDQFRMKRTPDANCAALHRAAGNNALRSNASRFFFKGAGLSAPIRPAPIRLSPRLNSIRIGSREFPLAQSMPRSSRAIRRKSASKDCGNLGRRSAHLLWDYPPSKAWRSGTNILTGSSINFNRWERCSQERQDSFSRGCRLAAKFRRRGPKINRVSAWLMSGPAFRDVANSSGWRWKKRAPITSISRANQKTRAAALLPCRKTRCGNERRILTRGLSERLGKLEAYAG
jgi:hypothetical protein